MKFRVFTKALTGCKIAVNIDCVKYIEVADESENTTYIHIDGLAHIDSSALACDDVPDASMVPVVIEVAEDFATVFSRLNTIAE